MTRFEEWYLRTAEDIVTNGTKVVDRTGTGTISVFNVDYTHNLLTDPFPILACRHFDYKKPIVEMIGFMLGMCNSEWYAERGCPFWNGFGLPEDVKVKVRRQDHVLADLYCSEHGKYKAFEPQYRKRYKELNALSFEDGLKKIVAYGIHLYEEVVTHKKGDLGPIYGHMWRHWPKPNGGEFDQLKYVFDELQVRPYNRRIIVNGWNPAYMPEFSLEPHENVTKGNMSLTPCHVLHEYHTSPIPLDDRVKYIKDSKENTLQVAWEAFSNRTGYNEEKCHAFLDEHDVPHYYLDLCWFQRSWDFMLGAPANIAGYTAMLMMMAKLQNMIPRYCAVKGFNVHVYTNHLEGLKTILDRRDSGVIPTISPKLEIDSEGVDFIDAFTIDNFTMTGYESLPHVKFPISF